MFSQSAVGVPPQAFTRPHHVLPNSAQSAFPPHPAVASATKQDIKIIVLIESSGVSAGQLCNDVASARSTSTAGCAPGV
jgi:hypothetical protein